MGDNAAYRGSTMFAPSVVLIAAIVFMPSAACAQPHVYEQGRSARSQRPAQQGDMNARLGVGQCYAWCPEDHTPCDPANFKIADARCRPAGAMGFSR